MSHPKYDITLERNVPSRMRDGVTLRADVYGPPGDGPFPVVLMRLPDDKAGALTAGDYAHPPWYAQHGFIVSSVTRRVQRSETRGSSTHHYPDVDLRFAGVALRLNSPDVGDISERVCAGTPNVGPYVWIEQIDAGRTERNTIHLDLDVLRDQVEARLATAA